MKNKWFVSLLMVVVMMCACWTGVLAEDVERETFTSGDYKYALLDDGTVEITGYSGDAEELIIPDTLAGKKVTSIGDKALAIHNSLFSVTIPDSVTQIGVNPFAYCGTLRSISISPEHPYFSAIDGVLFRKADKCLLSYPVGRQSVTYNIPQGITSIGDSAFAGHASVTAVIIPDSITSIGERAFYWCKSLTSITIPDSVTSIGKSAFAYCNSLTSITIPDSVTSIGDGAFSACDSLTSVTIPNSVTSIGDSAFSFCDSLTSVTIPDSITSIGSKTFSQSTSLISVTIPDSVTSIGDEAFSGCTSLTSVTIPDSVTSIGEAAFFLCMFLTDVTIPDSVTSIGDVAFGMCFDLTLTVPRNSYAAEYAKANNISYTYPDTNDWLNN